MYNPFYQVFNIQKEEFRCGMLLLMFRVKDVAGRTRYAPLFIVADGNRHIGAVLQNR